MMALLNLERERRIVRCPCTGANSGIRAIIPAKNLNEARS
jgi:hypothetical protein